MVIQAKNIQVVPIPLQVCRKHHSSSSSEIVLKKWTNVEVYLSDQNTLKTEWCLPDLSKDYTEMS